MRVYDWRRHESKNPTSIRKSVAERAGFCCEYCRLPEMDSFYGFQVDHIVSRKHGGGTHLINLAFACPDCNRNKGTDLGTFLHDHKTLIRFYNPRTDIWADHLEMDISGLIIAHSDIGAATIKIFDINHPDRIIERNLLRSLGIM